MPNILSGAIKIQKKYVAKKAAKKEEKILNGGIRPVNSGRAVVMKVESSDEEEGEVMSLLQIERPPEEAEEEEEENFPDDTVFASRVDVCDSESFYDDVVLTDMLEMDWERAIQEQPKVKMS